MLPDASDLLALEPEELAGVVLRLLYDAERGGDRTILHRNNFLLPGTVAPYPESRRDEIRRALAEAWAWLDREALIAQDPSKSDAWIFVTRLGRRLAESESFATYRLAGLLPRGILHPLIDQRVRPAFLRGAYDTAVFQAFKEVEIAVRKAGNFPPEKVGAALMHLAFDKSRGPLTDASLPDGEREGLRLLFAGTMQWLRNPSGHRNIEFSDPVEVVEMIVFASYLLRVVDRLSKKEDAAGGQ